MSASHLTPATKAKRAQFAQFVAQVLADEAAVTAVLGIGSIASGHMRPDSDIDAVVFMDPFDPYIVPAEAYWNPADDTFHSIFTDDDDLRQNGLQVDFLRLRWREWSSPGAEWSEPRKAEFASGWIVHDKTGELADLIAQKTAYDPQERQTRLDEAIIWLDQHLFWGGDTLWAELGGAIALDRMAAAYHYLVQALFALNGRWRPWRNREMQALLALPWLPDNFAERVLLAANTPSLDEAGFQARLQTLRDLFNELLRRLSDTGDYSPTPIDQAFMRVNEEPGRAWNMDEWNKFRQVRKL